MIRFAIKSQLRLSTKRSEEMKAVSYSTSGPAEVLQYTESYPKPARQKKQDVLVKIVATAINPVDWKIRKIRIPGQPADFIPGADFAGVVEECDADVSGFNPGDKVFGMLPILEAPGACAEFVVVNAKHIARAPTNISMQEVAALPLVALTVLQAFDKVGIKEEVAQEVKGKKILIHAGAGGVGSFAIQLASMYDLEVYTTCSERNIEYCTSLGATHCIDYNKAAFEDVAKDMDFILDTMGGDYELRSMKCIKSSGYYVNIMNSGWATKWSSGKTDGVSGVDSTIGSMIGYAYAAYRILAAPVVGPYYKFHVVQPDGKSLERVRGYVEAGRIKVNLDKVFDGLQQTADAHRYMEKGHTRGKVAITIDAQTAKL